jgi:hypothetical protein
MRHLLYTISYDYGDHSIESLSKFVLTTGLYPSEDNLRRANDPVDLDSDHAPEWIHHPPI